MLPLKVAFLWHQHQPYYKMDEEFILPWVRLHGVKDYFDLPEILYEFPEIKQTFNMVPSLMLQIDEYTSSSSADTVQKLTGLEAASLKDEDRINILNNFFLCNVENMVLPYPRFAELFERSKNTGEALKSFVTQDWLDLQVWYNLAWIGPYSRNTPKIHRLFNKGKGFTENEKQMVMDYHLEILRKISTQLETLRSLGQIEISVSPMYHPILPLLCDSTSALEAMPRAIMPGLIFRHPEDASAQIESACDYFKNKFGFPAAGMWPSEGSISDDALALIAKAGIKWVASDEGILANTLFDAYKPTEKFFPRKFTTKSGNISILFRDHFLSDNIGFVYSKWNPGDAARDFASHLRSIKAEIVRKHGEESLRHAVVPVILDGENCWEYYQNNGVPFLKALFGELSNKEDFLTVTCSEASMEVHADYLPPLNHIRAGSWINSNFSIWIGHREDRAAWDMLANAKNAIISKESILPAETIRMALDVIYIAEGSDWFWWYGDEHIADDKYKFDMLFRWYIKRVYDILGETPPDEVSVPIGEFDYKPSTKQPTGKISPVIDGMLRDEDKWDLAGYYDAKRSMSTMHQVGELLGRVWYGFDEQNMYFRIDTVRSLRQGDRIELRFSSPAKFTASFQPNGFIIEGDAMMSFYKIRYASDEIIEFSLSREIFNTMINNTPKSAIELSIKTISTDGELTYPRQGNIVVNQVV